MPPIVSPVSKQELVSDLHAALREISIRKVVALLEILINETRVDNDTASKDQFLHNQGKIQAFLSLKEYIERGIPARVRAQDGHQQKTY
jgi:hypothetical protein